MFSTFLCLRCGSQALSGGSMRRGRPEACTLAFFGASTGAAASLIAAAELGSRVEAVVSRGGRPDLAMEVLPQLHVPTLLIVGGADTEVIALNEMALARLQGPKSLVIVPGASHLFAEPGALKQVIDHAAKWFERYLAAETT